MLSWIWRYFAAACPAAGEQPPSHQPAQLHYSGERLLEDLNASSTSSPVMCMELCWADAMYSCKLLGSEQALQT